MKLDFRIDWGYQYLYSRRHYHPIFIWDGDIECKNGKIMEIYKLDYPYTWFGPVMCAKETRLKSTSFKDRTKRGISGIRIIADVDENAVFNLNTDTCSLEFSAKEIIEKGRLDFPVGSKYLGCSVTVTKKDFLWFRTPLADNETAFDADTFSLETHEWARMKLAWLHPGESAKWEYEVPSLDADFTEICFDIIAMCVPEYSPEKEEQLDAIMPLEILCDGKSVLKYKRLYRKHDFCVQLLVDDFKSVSIPAGNHIFELKNNHESVSLGISRIIAKPMAYKHGEIKIPEWCLSGENVVAKVFSAEEKPVFVYTGTNKMQIDCKRGWNEFNVSFASAEDNVIRTDFDERTIEVFDVKEENPPVMVGYDMTVVPHDKNGFMDFILDYTHYERLGNYVLFRSMMPDSPSYADMYEFADYCRRHGIYSAACFHYLDGAYSDGGKEMFHDCGLHEYPGAVYARDPKKPHASASMKEASEKYKAYLKQELDKAHEVCKTAAFGDASGGIRYSFLAGADFVRAETMVGNTMMLLSQARPAAEALGNGEWGVHIAIQHNYQPYHETHLGQYFLSLFQPWMMGANLIYEEDSLFSLWKEERQVWDDLLVKGKRDMTRAFYKFVKTHPREGKSVRNIGFIEGRYAAPFNGFICDSEQDPHYSVWGLFGNESAEWGHTQPEKCRQLLDVLMPGASTHPLRQRIDERRFFFAGTPYGDFDCIPTEAGENYFKNYKLLLHLGWNTMIDEDHKKLVSYVENGGILLTSILQFSTHEDREFLHGYDDLALYNGGDLSELCGFKVLGRGVKYCGQYNCKDKETMPKTKLSSMPNDSIFEDGEAYLAEILPEGCETVAWDTFTGNPILVRKKLGKGYAYTFTYWAYPGHELFQNTSADWIKKLAEESLGGEYVYDPTGEVFYTKWKKNDETVFMLLNTDWTVKGNIKTVEIAANQKRYSLDVKERTALMVKVTKDGIQPKYFHL